MRWRYGCGAPDRGSRARRRNTRSGNGHRAVARTVAAPNVLPQLKAGTPLEVLAYDPPHVEMFQTGRGRGPLENSLQFRNAGAAIGAGAKRSPDIGDVCGTPFSHSAADGFKSDTVTGADDRPGFGNALGASAGKKKTPVALG